MNQQNMIPPYVESTFHQILGVRNAKIADFKITAIKGSPNASDTSENLKTILSELAAMENQLEILVGMFPELEKAMPPLQHLELILLHKNQHLKNQNPKKLTHLNLFQKKILRERKLLCMKMVKLYLALNHLTLIILKSIY